MNELEKYKEIFKKIVLDKRKLIDKLIQKVAFQAYKNVVLRISSAI